MRHKPDVEGKCFVQGSVWYNSILLQFKSVINSASI